VAEEEVAGAEAVGVAEAEAVGVAEEAGEAEEAAGCEGEAAWGREVGAFSSAVEDSVSANRAGSL
jgi:hypothetical protein